MPSWKYIRDTCLTKKIDRSRVNELTHLSNSSGQFFAIKYLRSTFTTPKSKYIKRVHSVKIQRHTNSRANVMTRHQKQH